MALMTEPSRSNGNVIGSDLNRPDPFRPANLYRFQPGQSGNKGKRWLNYQERRSRILAVARRLMVDTGFEGVCFRDIAERCEISVPTIYNIVGDRTAVMHQASAEWVQWLGAAIVAKQEDGNKALQLLQYFWNSGIDHFEYTTTAVRAQRTPSAQPLKDAFNKTGIVLVSKSLAELRAARQLRSWVSIENLAGQLVLSANAGICNWALAPYETRRYWRDFANGPGLMLLGAVGGAEISIVERQLEAFLA